MPSFLQSLKILRLGDSRPLRIVRLDHHLLKLGLPPLANVSVSRSSSLLSLLPRQFHTSASR